jgi:hypothetical protein
VHAQAALDGSREEENLPRDGIDVEVATLGHGEGEHAVRNAVEVDAHGLGLLGGLLLGRAGGLLLRGLIYLPGVLAE